MHKKISLFMVLFLFLFSTGFAQVIGPDLQQALENDRNGEYKVIVELKEQFDVKALATERTQLVNVLKAKTKASQSAIRSLLNTQRTEAHYFWLVNAISLKADQNLIQEIAGQSSVKGIYLDEEQLMINPIQSHARTKAWGVEYIRANEVNVDLGDTVVAVVDTGVDLDHSGFAEGQILTDTAKSFVSSEATADDGNGHGTHCAGTVGSADYGVAPGVTILPVKVLSRSGSGSWSGVMQGVEYATEQKVDVISMSLGGRASSSGNVVETAVENAIDAGIVCVIAAGNSGHSTSPPYSIGTPGVVVAAVTVGAIDSSGNLAYFSSIGPTVNGDEKPDITAPGVSVPSLWKNGGTNTISGTSMATPHVAGLAALLVSKNPNMNPTAVKRVLMSTAKGKAEANKHGKGCVDAVNALRALDLSRNSRVEKVIEVMTDASGAVSKTQTIEAPWTVTMKDMKAVWSTSVKSSFDNVSVQLDGSTVFNQSVNNNATYTINKEVSGGSHNVSVTATGGPANTTVTVTVYINIW